MKKIATENTLAYSDGDTEKKFYNSRHLVHRCNIIQLDTSERERRKGYERERERERERNVRENESGTGGKGREKEKYLK
jgi:hypothetical protein